MRAPILWILCLLLSSTLGRGNADLPDRLSIVSQEYVDRLDTASGELVRTREAIQQERSPLAAEIRQLEEQVIGLETRISRLKTDQAEMEANIVNLEAQRESLNRNLDYLISLARDLSTGLEGTLLPGNDAAEGDLLQELKQDLEHSDVAQRHQTTARVFELVIGHIEDQLGGSVVEGLSVDADTMEVREGQFLHLGPVAYFRDTQSGGGGLASRTEGSLMPVTHPLPGWNPEIAADVFSGKPGYFLADSTGGKAVQLTAARGSLMDQVNKGGLVGYVIIALGILALLTVILKLWDLRGLSVDNPARIKGLIGQLNHNTSTETLQRLQGLSGS